MADIRINCEIYSHPKIKKLRRRLGAEAVHSLFQLWMWTAKNRPSGDLFGMSHEDIELAVDWTGEELSFAKTLIELSFLDDIDGQLVIHDWAEHNPWAANAQDRKDAARKAVKARWDKASGKYQGDSDRNTKSIQPVCGIDTDRNTELYAAYTDRTDSVIPSSLLISSNLNVTKQDSPSTPVVQERDTHAQAREARSASLAEFNRFYREYPLKVGRVKAEAAWLKQKLTDATPIIEALQAQQERRKVIDAAGGFVPHWRNPATWLNQRGWEDEELPLPETSTAIAKFEPRMAPQTQFEKNKAAIQAWYEMGDVK